MNIKLETIKHTKENIGGGKLIDTGLGDVFVDLTLIIQTGKGNKNRNKQIRLHQLKSFSTAKKIINKMIRQPTKWKKIVANQTSDKGSISKIYKELIQLNNNKQPDLKMGRRSEQTFFQRGRTDSQQAHERYSTSLIIK